MLSAAQLAESLEGKREGREYRCLCPVHNGHSLSIGERDGKLLVHCLSGCSQEDVVAALRERNLWDSAEEPIPFPVQPALVAEYVYRDSKGEPVAVKGRFRTPAGKTFAWRLPTSSEWKEGLKPLKERDLPLFGAHALGDRLVIMVEGEKAADACREAGLMAVCAAGGAGAKDFGDALTILQGHDIALWPDNDDAGRELMRRIQSGLPEVESVRWLAPEVPPKGDAFDYFEHGGSRDSLLAALEQTRTGPWLETLPDGSRVYLPEAGGFVCFEFLDLESGPRRALDADVTVWQDIPGAPHRRFYQRLNLASGSGRDTFRRQLDETFGKFDWTPKLSLACEMARDSWRNTDPSIVLIDAPEIKEDYLLRPFLLSDGPSCIFGAGGSGKTYLALAIAVCVSLGLPFIGTSVDQRAVLYIDYEWTDRRLGRRVRWLLAGMQMNDSIPAIFYWPGRGIPLWEQGDALRRKVQREDIGLVICDSAGYACGGDPLKQESATRYYNTLARIGVPSLTIAHNTKEGDNDFPLGAVYWHNGPRITWNTQYVSEERGKGYIGLFNRKGNDDALAEPVSLAIHFDSEAGVVSLHHQAHLPEEFGQERKLADRLREELARGERTVRELHLTLKGNSRLTQQSVRSTLSRHKDQFVQRSTGADGTVSWALLYRA